MKRIFSISALLAALILTSGCATTGDPTQGGIFWSEQKSNQRLAEKEYHLHGIQADTARQQGRANSLQHSVNSERNKLP